LLKLCDLDRSSLKNGLSHFLEQQAAAANDLTSYDGKAFGTEAVRCHAILHLLALSIFDRQILRSIKEPEPLMSASQPWQQRYCVMSTVEGQKTVAVIGNVMVGHKFCEKLVELDVDKQFKITSFCEEKKTAPAASANDLIVLDKTAFVGHRELC
jgi:hypothetical protein